MAMSDNPNISARFSYPPVESRNTHTSSYELFFNSQRVCMDDDPFMVPPFFERLFRQERKITTNMIEEALNDASPARARKTLERMKRCARALDEGSLDNLVMTLLIKGCEWFGISNSMLTDVMSTGQWPSDREVIMRAARELDWNLNPNRQICHYLERDKDNRIMILAMGTMDSTDISSVELLPFNVNQLDESPTSLWGKFHSSKKWEYDVLNRMRYDFTTRVWIISEAEAAKGKDEHKDYIRPVPYTKSDHEKLTASVKSWRLGLYHAGETDPDARTRLEDLQWQGTTYEETYRFADLWKLNEQGACDYRSVIEGFKLYTRSVLSGPVLSPDRTTLTFTEGDNTMLIWNLRTDQRIMSIETDAKKDIKPENKTWSPNGRFIVTYFQGLRVWDVETGERVVDLDEMNSEFYSVPAVAFSPDGQRIAIAVGDYGRVQIHEFNSRSGKIGNKVTEFKSHGSRDYRLLLKYSPDGEQIACGTVGSEVRLFEAATAKYIRSIVGSFDEFVFSPDSKLLAGGDMEEATVWDAKNVKTSSIYRLQKLIKKFKWLNGAVKMVCFSPDTRLFAAVDDRTIRIYDTTTWECLRILKKGDNTQLVRFLTNDTMLCMDVWAGNRILELDIDRPQPTFLQLLGMADDTDMDQLAIEFERAKASARARNLRVPTRSRIHIAARTAHASMMLKSDRARKGTVMRGLASRIEMLTQ